MKDNAFTNTVKRVLAFIKRNAIRAFNYLKVAKMEWIVMIAVFIIDLVSKSLVENFLEFNRSVPMIPYFLNAHRVHNYAAAFGSGWLHDILGNVGARIFYCVFAVAASVAFILVLIKNKGKNKVLRISLALFVAGAMGNCVDRMALGYVRDFIEFVYFGLTIGGKETWPYIFNIADVALVTGVILIIFYFLFLYRDPDKKKLSAAGDGEGDVVLSGGEIEQASDGEQAQQDEINNVEQTDGVPNEDEAEDAEIENTEDEDTVNGGAAKAEQSSENENTATADGAGGGEGR